MKNFTGLTINQYHITQQLGHGGMATVYKAYDTRNDRDVAFKMIRVEDVPEEFLDQVLERFKQEAEIQARFRHPNIIPVYESGNIDGIPFLVMEYLPGGTLKQRMNKKLSLRTAVRILLPIADALAYAHSLGVIHRDIKPSNILFNEQRMPMLNDFGTAKVLEPVTKDPVKMGVGIGTPAYMAPEQWHGIAVPQTDVYAMGVVLYEIITGTRPFNADTPIAVALKQAGEPIPNPRNFVDNLPIQAEHFLYRALAKDIDNRFSSMAEMKVALEKLGQISSDDEQRVKKSLVYDLETESTRKTTDSPPLTDDQEPVNQITAERSEDLLEYLVDTVEDKATLVTAPRQLHESDLPHSKPEISPQEDTRKSTEVPQELVAQESASQDKARRPLHTKPHARAIPITEPPLNNRFTAVAQPQSTLQTVGRGFNWFHVFLLSFSWGAAFLIAGWVVPGFTKLMAIELAMTLGSALAWLLGGIAIAFIFMRAITLDKIAAGLIPPTFAFAGGLSMLIGYIVNSKGGWIFSTVLLWGLIGMIISMVFNKPGKISGRGMTLMTLGWAAAGLFSALVKNIQLDTQVSEVLSKFLGYLVLGGIEGLLFGGVLGLVTGLVFVKPLATGWWRVILLSMFWALGMAFGHAISSVMVNAFELSSALATGLGWAISTFFIFVGVKLSFGSRLEKSKV